MYYLCNYRLSKFKICISSYVRSICHEMNENCVFSQYWCWWVLKEEISNSVHPCCYEVIIKWELFVYVPLNKCNQYTAFANRHYVTTDKFSNWLHWHGFTINIKQSLVHSVKEHKIDTLCNNHHFLTDRKRVISLKI